MGPLNRLPLPNITGAALATKAGNINIIELIIGQLLKSFPNITNCYNKLSNFGKIGIS